MNVSSANDSGCGVSATDAGEDPDRMQEVAANNKKKKNINLMVLQLKKQKMEDILERLEYEMINHDFPFII